MPTSDSPSWSSMARTPTSAASLSVSGGMSCHASGGDSAPAEKPRRQREHHRPFGKDLDFCPKRAVVLGPGPPFCTVGGATLLSRRVLTRAKRLSRPALADMRQYGYPSCTHRGVLLSPGEAVVVAAVASLQPAGSCRDALARMLRREMALAAAAGRRQAGLAGEVSAPAAQDEPPGTSALQERETARRAPVTKARPGKAPQADIAAAAGLPSGYVLLARMAGFLPAADLSPGLHQAGQVAARRYRPRQMRRRPVRVPDASPAARPGRAEIRARIPGLAPPSAATAIVPQPRAHR